MITKEFHEQMITDVDKFNQFIKEYTEVILQRVILEVPNMVLYHIQETQKTEKLKEEFYNDNPGLRDQPSLVVQSVNAVTSQHPEWDRRQVYKEAGLKANKILSMEKSNGQGF